MSYIIAWKVAGELVKPKYITKGLKRPWLVWNTAFHLEFCEEPGSFQMINEIIDQREQVLVLHGHHIKHPVVLYKLEAAVFLFDEEDRQCHW